MQSRNFTNTIKYKYNKETFSEHFTIICISSSDYKDETITSLVDKIVNYKNTFLSVFQNFKTYYFLLNKSKTKKIYR